MADKPHKAPEPEAAALIKTAEAKMLQAEMARGPHRDVLYSEAKDALLCAEQLDAGSGAWKLSCISARLGQEKLCKRWLERARKRGTLPGRDTIEKSPYFAESRKLAWFKQFLKSLR